MARGRRGAGQDISAAIEAEIYGIHWAAACDLKVELGT
jgi:hypothetical protein